MTSRSDSEAYSDSRRPHDPQQPAQQLATAHTHDLRPGLPSSPAERCAPPPGGINHVALEVGDLEAALAFYGAIFELRGIDREPGMAFIDMGDQFIALSEGRSQPPDQSSALRPRRRRQAGGPSRPARRKGSRSFPARGSTSSTLGQPDPGVDYRDIQFTKAPPVIRGMGLEHLRKRDPRSTSSTTRDSTSRARRATGSVDLHRGVAKHHRGRPGRSRHRPTRAPFTVVPFVDPRSQITQWPSRKKSRACRRDTRSLASTTSQSRLRPSSSSLWPPFQLECEQHRLVPRAGATASA